MGFHLNSLRKKESLSKIRRQGLISSQISTERCLDLITKKLVTIRQINFLHIGKPRDRQHMNCDLDISIFSVFLSQAMTTPNAP